MFHVKIWLSVILMGVVTLMMWVMQPFLIGDVVEWIDRTKPLIYSHRFENGVRQYYKKLELKGKQFADTSSLETALGKIKYTADPITKEISYTTVRSDLSSSLPTAFKLGKNERIYIVSNDGVLLYVSHRPEGFDYNKSFALPAIPHVQDAFRGRVRTGIWQVGLLKGKSKKPLDKMSGFVVAAPIKGFMASGGGDGLLPPPGSVRKRRKRRRRWRRRRRRRRRKAPPLKIKKKKVVLGAILYIRKLDDTAFTGLVNSMPKKDKKILKDVRVILFNGEKVDDDVDISPFAYNVSGKAQGFLRGWFKQKAIDEITETYTNGMDRSLLKARIQNQDYTYAVSKFPGDLSLGDLGYALLIPVPNRSSPEAVQGKTGKKRKEAFYLSYYPRFLSLICFIICLVLASWLSGAEIFYFRRTVPHLQTAPQEEFPEISEKGLSRPWRELVASINKIFTMIRERGLGEADMSTNQLSIQLEQDADSGRQALSYLANSGEFSSASAPASTPPPPSSLFAPSSGEDGDDPSSSG